MTWYLTGASNEAAIAASSYAALGLMAQPWSGTSAQAHRWPVVAADNGCFTRPDLFDLAHYLRWLSARMPRERCLFATAPDVVGDARATWIRSRNVFGRIRALGLPAALVAQDGIEATRVRWDAFDALFIGGTTEFKLGPVARHYCQEAAARGKWVHVGRVNSRRRYELASSWNVDSVDGTYLAFGPRTNLPKLLSWIGGGTT